MALIFEHQAVIALVLLALLLAAFVSERWPPEVVALSGAAVMLALGILSADAALSVLSNSAPVTIAALFVLSGALVRTGVLAAASRVVMRRTQGWPNLGSLTMLVGTMTASAFMNNTPLVMVLMPIVLQLARATRRSASRLLIPLSYAAILGGTCTLIGTSTNILVDGVARRQGLAPFGLFEITPLGVIVAAVGGPIMVLASTRLLPERTAITEAIAGREAPRFLTELTIARGSPLVGSTPAEIAPLAAPDVLLLALRRRGRLVTPPVADAVLKTYDRLVVVATADELLALHELPGLKVGRSPDVVPMVGKQVVEALVAPGPSLVGRRLRDLRLPARYGVYPLAVHRYGKLAGTDLDAIRLRTGDTILLEGTPSALGDLAMDVDLLNLSEPQAHAVRRHKAPIALAAIGLVVVLAAFAVMPISALAIMAVAVVLLTRCLEAREAWASIDGRLLILIFSMLAVGRGVEDAGALRLMVDTAKPFLQDAPPLLVLASLYMLTSVLTEVVTNNAVAVIVTPLAVSLATELGLDPRPFVVAVMFGASASFATPIGYQTNTLVYTVGGYRFTDFLRIGVPMNIVVGVVSVLVIPMIWPLR